MNLYQGNTYNLKVKIFDHNKNPLNLDDIEKIEFCLGTVTKLYPDEVLAKEDYFIVPLTQEDTFSLSGISVRYQFRVKFKNGTVTCTKQTNARILSSISEEVL